MNKLKSLLRVFSGKAALCAVLTALFVAASLPLFAQSAEVRYAGVFYKEFTNKAGVDNVYCDYSLAKTPSLAGLKAASSTPSFYTQNAVMAVPVGNSNCTPKVSAMVIGEIRSDGDFKVQLVARDESIQPSGLSSRVNSKQYSLNDKFYVQHQYYAEGNCEVNESGFLYPKAGVSLSSFYDTYQVVGYNAISSSYTIDITNDSLDNRSFVYKPNPSGNQNKVDPWVSSALIEYDQPYSSVADGPTNTTTYPNHCLALCMNVYCTNKPMAQSTYSIAFPLQQVKFDIVKYYNNKNVENPEETPAVRTIDLYPDVESNAAKCGSYTCPGGEGYTCPAPLYELYGDTCYEFGTDKSVNSSHCTVSDTNCPNKACKYVIFNNDGTRSNKPIPFCAAWDGSYEIAGEFGKSNGQFAFRATVATDVPGDNIITDKIEFNSTIAYPGMNQIPIQVDVTNVHTVRSTPSVVGNITAVSAQPYTYAYRLSKDADVRIAIFDASTGDAISYENNNTTSMGSCSNPAYNNSPSACIANGNTWQSPLVRTLVDWQPRLGEGMKGVEKDVQITEFDSWDGRNANGLLLPAGNYVVSLQAKSQDEWPGVDFSRAVTRQMSLDPLKLTDIVATGLNKQSTGYASISYVPTEPAKIYWNIYTPGTSFVKNNSGAMLTDSSTPTGTAPTAVGGSLVYSSVEDRTGRMNFTSKWDGLCNQVAGCTRTYAKNEKMSDGTLCAANAGCTQTFANGSPMPDGNYIYVLWAEIPYNGKYLNAVGGSGTPAFTAGQTCSGSGQEINNQCFTGVKTLKYDTGIVAIERGMVDITIQPVSYSTIGSSPTAYGLDPFIFKYSIVRDATAIAKVENTAGVVVKYLTPQEGVSQVAQQMNTLSWDGRDEAGRMVTPGTYMFVVETKDAMFPAVTNRAAAVFPVDMYRVVDVNTTDVYGDSEAKATITYQLSKAMNVQVNIYNKDVVIPAYNNATGAYGDVQVTASYTGTTYTNDLTNVAVVINDAANTSVNLTGLALGVVSSLPNNTTRRTVTVTENPNYVAGSAVPAEARYKVTLVQETITITANAATAWPPRICDRGTDVLSFKPSTAGEDCSDINKHCYIDPAKNPQCIYVNDTTFTNYPASATEAASGVVDVRLQPIKTFDRSSTRVGDGIPVTEEWDALYFYNPTSTQKPGACAGSKNLKACPYEMVPDGQYPFFISARSNEAFDRYYANANEQMKKADGSDDGTNKYLAGAPFKYPVEVVQENYLYATEKPVSKINVTRGPVYFLDGSTIVYPNAPQLFNVSSGPIFIPPYEINFAVSRAATVEVAIVALGANVCNPDPTVRQDLKNNKPGDVCKFLSTMTIMNTGDFDPNVTRKIYWDGTDNNGFYVKPGIYEVRLTAKNYPDPGLYQETVKSITLNADLLKVFDLLEADGYAISQRGTDMKIGYQISVPMKVAIQIFKPGTTIYDYEKGTLRNPTTGKEVQDIHEVLVRAIVGIRPATTLIEEVWDGRDYAQQEVPDGTYPFRFVTALNSADIDSVTGEILGGDNTSTDYRQWDIFKVADAYEYQNLHRATIAIGDGRFVCEDWEKTVFFYPNPLKNREDGTLEITKMPVPGKVSIKFFNLAGDLVKDSNYTCVDANNYQVTMGDSLSFNPDNVPTGANQMTETQLNGFQNVRNAALRCRWTGKNQHGKNVARGVYFGLVDFKAQNGREHCQKVVKVLIP